jgi:AcrR family transcriptional regulator
MTENEPLTRERFVAAAWDLIEERGFDALTMRSLGAALGVSASAVYTYFPEREQLVAALADELLGRIRPAERSLPARERLAIQAQNARELLRRHPDIGQVVAMSPGDSTAGPRCPRGWSPTSRSSDCTATPSSSPTASTRATSSG